MRAKSVYKYFRLERNEASDMIVCAMVIGISSIIVTVVDFCWLIGDYIHASAPHHIGVGIGLIIGLAIMIASFIWLISALKRRASKHKAKQRKLHMKPHDLVPHHCNVNPKRVIVKPDYSRYEGLD